MPSIAFANATATEENSMNVPREGSGLNQWMGLHLLLHSAGKSLMQCTAAIELLIVFNGSGMPAGGLCASAKNSHETSEHRPLPEHPGTGWRHGGLRQATGSW